MYVHFWCIAKINCGVHWYKLSWTQTGDTMLGLSFFCVSVALASEPRIDEVRIRAGTFEMGCTKEQGNWCFSDEKPSHRVTLSRDFFMMRSEVTQKLYQTIMAKNPSVYQSCGSSCPVDNVSWFDAVRFAQALNKKLGLEECYEITQDNAIWSNKECLGWRLPTEAEWEYAARGGGTHIYSGSNLSHEIAKSKVLKKSHATYPVCGYKKNEYGLCDMSGNVFEWVWDNYGLYKKTAQIDPVFRDMNNPAHVRRGGSWCDFAKYCRVSIRYGSYGTFRFQHQGFRLVRLAPKEEATDPAEE